MLSLLGGLDIPSEGKILFQGEDIVEKGFAWHRKNNVAFIFQSYNLIPHQTILANVELALTISGIGKEERRTI